MAGHSFVQLYALVRSSLSIFFILVLAFVAEAAARKRFDDIRLRMLEAFAKSRFDAINQGDINILKSMMPKTSARGRPFHYTWQLHGAMQRETKRLDYLDDYSSRDWIIRTYRPATYDEETATFTNCTFCSRPHQEASCNLTRIELLVPLVHDGGAGSETRNGLTYLVIDGHTVNSYRGTVNISGAAIFDLTYILNKSEDISSTGILKIKIKRPPCRYVFPNRSMLYEYCNINNTILERFWTYNQKETKKPNHEEFESNNKNNAEDGSAEMPETIGLVDELKEPWAISDTVHADIMGIDRNATNSIIFDTLGPFSPSTIDNYNKDTTSTPSTLYRKVRSLFQQAGNDSQPVKTNSLSRHQPRRLNTTRKHYKKKRHLGNPVFRDSETSQEDDMSSFKPDRLSGECKRHPFSVNFQLHMNRWDIIEPDDYVDVGYCSNSCRHASHFSNVRDYLTAHAVIMNSVRGKSTPSISCTPHKMSSISILKMIDMGVSFVVENLWNAKVESCWCT